MNKVDSILNEIKDSLEVWNWRLSDEGLIENNKSFHAESWAELVKNNNIVIDRFDIPMIGRLHNEIDRLTKIDIVVGLLVGSCGALMPTLTNDTFDRLHQKLSKSNGFIGTIFNHMGQRIDTHERKINGEMRRVVLGTFHRFRPDGMHDILNLNGLITSIKQLGVLGGFYKYYIHLILDMCSKTGIPVPGSTNFLYKIREYTDLRLFGLKDQSEWAGLRMGDFVQMGTTEGLIQLYFNKEKIEKDSLRRFQIAIIAHGFSIIGASFIAMETGNTKLLSKISYPSILLLIKKIYLLNTSINRIDENIIRLDVEINNLIDKYWNEKK